MGLDPGKDDHGVAGLGVDPYHVQEKEAADPRPTPGLR